MKLREGSEHFVTDNIFQSLFSLSAHADEVCTCRRERTATICFLCVFPRHIIQHDVSPGRLRRYPSSHPVGYRIEHTFALYMQATSFHAVTDLIGVISVVTDACFVLCGGLSATVHGTYQERDTVADINRNRQ